jgi:superfamily II DNA or RNA helicase
VPRIFDNIDLRLLPALRDSLAVAHRADFCVGYFNLRGWRTIGDSIEELEGGEGKSCRVLVGMTRLPEDDLRQLLSLGADDGAIDNARALQLKTQAVEAFRQQLLFGAPTNADEAGLRRLRGQLRSGKLQAKLHLRHALHAKLYLAYRTDNMNPRMAFVGSSNLTFSGLSGQGELNLDVLDDDACVKLEKWFKDRWEDRFSWDITEELADVIDESWARDELILPYHVYLKIAYHLSQEARAGLAEFSIPREFSRMLDWQVAAVKIAAHHLNKRGGVLLGDVVGFGKTLMATAVARTLQDDQDTETLVICPKNLVKMWQDYIDQYRVLGKVLSLSEVQSELPDLRRYRVVVIDESHNLRNPEGRRYQAIRDYVERNSSRVILLSATPYNKSYRDLAAQLGLFVPNDLELEIRPEVKLRSMGETEFIRQFQCGVRSLAAFEKSEYADDWRDLMRLYMVRRTRSFIERNYGTYDPERDRYDLAYADGTLFSFPRREPRNAKFEIQDADPKDQYARLYSPPIVSQINNLHLPRYGLANYLERTLQPAPTAKSDAVLRNLTRAGKRLMGFCRTNLFKRLESGGPALLQSIERHALRNFVYIHALENGLEVPIGSQEATLLDSRLGDQDADGLVPSGVDDERDPDDVSEREVSVPGHETEAGMRRLAVEIYNRYQGQLKGRFSWLPASYFTARLRDHLLEDARALLEVLDTVGPWNSSRDAKLNRLLELLTVDHPDDKVLVFTQFADTVAYLTKELGERKLPRVAGVTGLSGDPTDLAWRFSPISNEKEGLVRPTDELRVLIATDVLSEGQNLQDCSIVVNYDLPWAIIRLVQRAGRVDRIGQAADTILCYSFLPAEGVERLLGLRRRVRQRLRENAEVVGTDEQFFEDDPADVPIVDVYNEKAGIFDDEEEGEVDLASYAYQIWKNAVDDEPALASTIPALPNVIYSSRSHASTEGDPDGVLVYLRTGADNDALAWVDTEGKVVTQSQVAILRAAECGPAEPALPRAENHHDLVQRGVSHVLEEESQVGGALGRPSGARFRTYERLKRYAESVSGSLWDTPELKRAVDEVYRYPLTDAAKERLNRQLRTAATDPELAELAMRLREEGRLSRIEQGWERRESQIICSLGLIPPVVET